MLENISLFPEMRYLRFRGDYQLDHKSGGMISLDGGGLSYESLEEFGVRQEEIDEGWVFVERQGRIFLGSMIKRTKVLTLEIVGLTEIFQDLASTRFGSRVYVVTR